jgi:hypothetical protein
MPLKLSASFCKKVPAEQEYSSKSYLASVEVELPTNLSGDELNAEIHKTYAQLERAVEEQINGKTSGESGRKQPRSQSASDAPVKASNKQIKYLLDLGKAREKRLADLNVEVGRLYGVESIYELTKKDASKFVDVLKEAA